MTAITYIICNWWCSGGHMSNTIAENYFNEAQLSQWERTTTNASWNLVSCCTTVRKSHLKKLATGLNWWMTVNFEDHSKSLEMALFNRTWLYHLLLAHCSVNKCVFSFIFKNNCFKEHGRKLHSYFITQWNPAPRQPRRTHCILPHW